MTDFSQNETYRKAIGLTIADAECRDDLLFILFTDGTSIGFYDQARECCEYRYMDTDDDLTQFSGSKFMGVEVRDGGYRDSEETHEVMFLVVNTSLGSFTVQTHNEHNGYYGGFDITIADEGQ